MFAVYVKVRKQLEVYERGLAEYHPETNRFDKVVTFPDAATYPGEYPGGHAFLHRDQGVEYVYYCNPYPLLRVPADPEQLARIDSYAAYSCLKPGTRWKEQQLDRGPNAHLRHAWKTRTQLVPQEEQNKLIASGSLKPAEALLHLQRHRLGQGRDRTWGLRVLEQVSATVGDDCGGVARQPRPSWVRFGLPRLTRRSGPGFTPEGS